MDLFRAKAPVVMRDLMRDFPTLKVEDAAAITGNLGHECAGFTKLQEVSPTVKGSRGGYGWPQWTGPRRRAYEAWCKAQKLNPASDAANYGYLVVELRGPEKKAIPATVKAVGLAAKVKAFELGFERAGVKHYESRTKWAQRALDAWNAKPGSPTPEKAQPGLANPPSAKPGIWASFIAILLKLVRGGQ
jgi:hypothetical protein